MRLRTSDFKDTARDIYKNATIEKLALIRFILQREEKVSNHLRASEVNLEVCMGVN
jgi:hypothetical protein